MQLGAVIQQDFIRTPVARDHRFGEIAEYVSDRGLPQGPYLQPLGETILHRKQPRVPPV